MKELFYKQNTDLILFCALREKNRDISVHLLSEKILEYEDLIADRSHTSDHVMKSLTFFRKMLDLALNDNFIEIDRVLDHFKDEFLQNSKYKQCM